MRYRAKAFPYPVLSTFSNDFKLDTQFHLDIEATLAEDNAQRLNVYYDITQTSAWMNEYIIDGNAKLVLDVECRSTLFRKFLTVDALSGSFDFEEGQLYGPVDFTPLIIATTDNSAYRPMGIDDEFGSSTFEVHTGDILGIGHATALDIEFSRTLDRNLVKIHFSKEPADEGVYHFKLDGPQIIIIAGENLKSVIGHMLEKHLRPYLFMSIYKDCIAAALNYLAGDEAEEANELSWSRTLWGQLQELGRELKPDNPEYQEVTAQLLVNARGVKKVEASFV